MNDPDTRDPILFITLLALSLVILILGISVLTRLARRRGDATIPGFQFEPGLVTLILVVVAFFAVFLPYLAVLPALLFFFRGALLLRLGPGLPREGGAVVLLVGIAWSLYTAIEVFLLAWGKTVSGPIRVDILLTVPLMGVLSYIGWRIPWAAARSGFAE
jgi:hypothetical protein